MSKYKENIINYDDLDIFIKKINKSFPFSITHYQLIILDHDLMIPHDFINSFKTVGYLQLETNRSVLFIYDVMKTPLRLIIDEYGKTWGCIDRNNKNKFEKYIDAVKNIDIKTNI